MVAMDFFAALNSYDFFNQYCSNLLKNPTVRGLMHVLSMFQSFKVQKLLICCFFLLLYRTEALLREEQLAIRSNIEGVANEIQLLEGRLQLHINRNTVCMDPTSVRRRRRRRRRRSM